MGRFHLSLSKKAIFAIVIFAILLIAVPLTVYVVQQQQQTQSSAAPATTLSFTKSAPTGDASIDDEITVDVMANPDTNLISQVLLYIDYDPEMLEPDETEFFVGNDAELTTKGYSVYRTPTIVDEDLGVISAGYTLSQQTTGGPSNLGIRCATTPCAPTKIGTLKFKALAAGTTTIKFLRSGTTDTFIKSSGTSDTAVENALLNAPDLSITIIGPEETPTPSPSSTPTPSPSASPSASASPAASPVGEAPLCSSLDADPIDGSAPLAVTFTANGSDSDGTVEKITFTYGDGNTEDVTEGGGLGSGTVNTQASHTYSDGGTFEASAVLTDSDGNASTACTQSITVAAAEVAQASPSAEPLPPTGPSSEIIGVGVLGAILTGIGILLFLAL